MRTIEDIKTDIEFVKQDIKECKERGDNTWAAQRVLDELMRELRQKERGLQRRYNPMTDLERRALLGDRQAQLFLGLSHHIPQFSPGFEFLVRGEDVLHLLTCVTLGQRALVSVVHKNPPIS